MKKSFKKVLSCVLCILMVCTMVFSVSAASKVTINLFGENVTIPDDYGVPFIDKNTERTLVPARGVFEAMGAEVLWNGEKREVTVKKDSDVIVLTLDSCEATKNGEAKTLDQPAVLVGGRTFIPLRFVAESLDLDVGFDGATTTVIIKEKEMKKVFEAGKYVVGKDIKTDEYLLVANGNAEIKMLRGEDSANAENVIVSLPFKNSIYVNIIGADYIETVNCTMYSLDSVPTRGQSGIFKNGMFKTGFDFEVGKYTLSKVVASETASYKIYDSAYSTAGEGKIKSSGLITKNETISLEKNQYIVLENVQLKKAEAVINGGGGGGSSRPSGGGGSSRPSGGGGSSSKPTETPTVEPTEEPTEKPTEEPTEEPTEVPPQESVETPDEPEISGNEYYEGYEDEVLDFGNFFSIALISKSEGLTDDGKVVISYEYDISLFTESGKFDSLLFNQYIEKMFDFGFGLDYKLGSKPGERELYNIETGLIVKTTPNEQTIVVEILQGEPDSSLDDVMNG